MRRLYLLDFVFLLTFMPACSDVFDDAQYAPDIKLGAKEKTVTCAENYGACSFDVVSNCNYTVSIVKGAEWLSFTGYDDQSPLQLSGSTTLSLSYTSNRGYRRSASVVLTSGSRHDTLTVKQLGIYEQVVEADRQSLSVPGVGTACSVGITTNLLKKDFAFETVDASGYPLTGKADKFKYTEGVFSFRIRPSESRDEKTFIVRLYALDDWGEKVSADIIVVQEPGRE